MLQINQITLKGRKQTIYEHIFALSESNIKITVELLYNTLELHVSRKLLNENLRELAKLGLILLSDNKIKPASKIELQTQQHDGLKMPSFPSFSFEMQRILQILYITAMRKHNSTDRRIIQNILHVLPENLTESLNRCYDLGFLTIYSLKDKDFLLTEKGMAVLDAALALNTVYCESTAKNDFFCKHTNTRLKKQIKMRQ